MAEEKNKHDKTKAKEAEIEDSGFDPVLKAAMTDGEKLIFNCRIHNAIYWKSVAVFLLSLIFALYGVTNLAILFFIVAFFLGLQEWAMKQIMRLALSDKRVLARQGLIQIDVIDIPFDRIESVELERMLTGQLFGYASVVVMGTGNRYIRIPYVADAQNFRRAYNQQILED